MEIIKRVSGSWWREKYLGSAPTSRARSPQEAQRIAGRKSRLSGLGYAASALRTLRLALTMLTACALLLACAATPAGKPDEAYVKAAWAYFKHKCDTEAGEKIYKTFTGVKSVLVVKPLPPATEKDLYDQFWYGDPYSNATPWDKRGLSAALKLASKTAPIEFGKRGHGYEFVEMQSNRDADVTTRYSYSAGAKDYSTAVAKRTESRFGISWEDISTAEDRNYWIAGSRLRVIDLSNNNVVAERIGYLIEPGFGSTVGQRRPWLTARGIGLNGHSCPAVHDYSDRWFLIKVLRPELEIANGK